MRFDRQLDAHRALNDETRLRILQLIQRSGGLYTSQIMESFAVSQPTMSYHLKLLTGARLLQSKKDGRKIYYTLNKATFEALATSLLNFVQE